MSWQKVKLGDLCTIEKGKTGIQKAISGEYPLVVTAEDRKSHNEYQFDDVAVIIPLVSGTGHGHASIKRLHFQSGKFALGSILCAVIPKDKSILNAEYLFRFLNLNKERELVDRMKGMANVTLPIKEIAKIEIPLPSLEEQIKFVEKYALLENESEDISSELTHQLDLIKHLRQAFLREAMQGRFEFPQQPLTEALEGNGFETGQQLLAKIKAEKAQLIKTKKLKAGLASSQSINLIDDYVIPNNWTWCKADEIFFITKLAGFEYSKNIRLMPSGEIPVIRAQNVRPLEIKKTNLLYIDRQTSLLLDRCALTKKCLLVTFIGAGIGDVSTFNEKERWHLAPNVAKLEPFIGCEDLLNVKFINFFLMSDIGQIEIFKHVKATAQPSLSMGTLRDIDIPIPSKLEQDQIVAKLEELMAFCDGLEQSIKESQGYNEMLLQQVLREALQGEVIAV
jgi:type I restriction enzyme S subunit